MAKSLPLVNSFKYRNMRSRFFLLLSLIFFTYEDMHSQDDTVCLEGHVNDANEAPVRDAYIYIDSIRTNIKTNRKGKFSICLPNDAQTISVYSFSYGILEVPYTAGSELQFTFSEEDKIITETELANLGYNTTIRKKYKGRKKKAKDYSQYQNVYQMLVAEIPGVQVSGETIFLRGTARKSLTNEPAPLLFINGTQVSSLNTVIPNEIKSLKVIRNEEAALYGSRGSGGIIKIELKH